MARRKLSKKQLKKLHAKKATKGFSIWEHQTADEPKEIKAKDFNANESKKRRNGKHEPFLPEF